MEIAEVLRKNGYKVTPQRLAVYEAINHNPTHPNAEAIYKILQPNYPSMSLATVYKTMEIFAKIGVVQVLQCAEDAHRYDYNTTPHAHIRCEKCNRVIDIDMDLGFTIFYSCDTCTISQVTSDDVHFFLCFSLKLS